MTDKRLLFALPAVMLLAACGGESPATEGGAASGEVLEGTISDEMLPVDSLRSEPPLEDPEAFAEAQDNATAAGAASEDGERAEDDEPAGESADPAAPAPTSEPADE